jgi:hypothetical protein
MSRIIMKLRLESRNGSPAKEYRIAGGNVEVRTFDCRSVVLRTACTASRGEHGPCVSLHPVD